MPKNSVGYVKVDTDEPSETYEDLQAEQAGDLVLRPLLHDDTIDRASSHGASKGITEAKSRPGRISISSPLQAHENSEDQQEKRHKHPEGSAESMVEKVVPETDDPTMLTNTIRVWLIGGMLGAMGAGINQIFFFKSNGIGFGGFFITLVSYAGQLACRFYSFSCPSTTIVPVLILDPHHETVAGKLMAVALPAWNIKLPNPFGFLSPSKPNRWFLEVSLNPGEFSVKEHVLIGVLAGCASSAAYAGDIVAVQDLYYHVSKKYSGILVHKAN